MAKKKHYASKMGHRRDANSEMRGYDNKAYDFDGADMGTKRDVTGSDMGRYDEGMIDGRGQFANLPQQVIQREWPKYPTSSFEEYPNGLMAVDRQMKRDKKGVHKVGLPNKG